MFWWKDIIMQIYPASYSKAKTVEAFLTFLTAAPKQVANSPEAVAGNVLEFTENGHGPVGTLPEMSDHFHTTKFDIKIGGDMVSVTCNENGDWVQKVYGRKG